MLSPDLGCGYVATRVHHAARRRYGVAARRTRAQQGRERGPRITAAIGLVKGAMLHGKH